MTTDHSNKYRCPFKTTKKKKSEIEAKPMAVGLLIKFGECTTSGDKCEGCWEKRVGGECGRAARGRAGPGRC